MNLGTYKPANIETDASERRKRNARRPLVLLALAEWLVMTAWFSATAVATSLAIEWRLDEVEWPG